VLFDAGAIHHLMDSGAELTGCWANLQRDLDQ
jgi:hypothetical protein